MKLWMITAAALAAAPALASPQAGNAADQAAINKIETDWTAAWNRHDAAGISKLFAESGKLVNPRGRVAKGRAEVKRLLEDEHAGALKASTYSATCEPPRFLSEGVALEGCAATVEGIQSPEFPSGTSHVLVTSVLGRGDDGWQILSQSVVRVLPARPASAGTARKE